MKNHKKAFTLAEAISVLVVLGIVAAISVPVAISKHRDVVNKTRLQNALAVYDTLVKSIVSENRIQNKARLDQFASIGNCSNLYDYIRPIESHGCVLKTADGVWWDFGTAANNTSLSNTLVAFDRNNLTKNQGWSETTNNAFYFHSEFDDKHVLRVQDMDYSNFKGDISGILDCAKTYAYLNSKKMYDYYNVCNGNNKVSCIYYDPAKDSSYLQVFYSNNGQRTGIRYGCSDLGEGCGSSAPPSRSLGDNYSIGATCDTRGFCEDGKYYVTHYTGTANSNFPSNMKGKTAQYNGSSYSITAVRETQYQCNSDAQAGFVGCSGNLRYESIYKNGNKGLQVFYSDENRTTITEVRAYDDSNSYWKNEGTYKCSSVAATIEACISGL